MNRKGKGYIYIFTIILISLLALFFYFIYSYISNTSYINLNRVEKIQSKYVAESVLNIKISENNFNGELRNFIFSNEKYIKLNCEFKPSDTEVKNLELRRRDYSNKKGIDVDLVELNTDVKYKNSIAGAKIMANYINEIYKEEDGVLNSGKVNKDDLEKIKNSFNDNNWSKGEIKVLNLDGDFIYGTEKGKKFIFEEVEVYDENLREKVKKRSPLYLLDNVDVIVQKNGTLNIETDIRDQILLINNKVLFNDNAISGIIILNNNAEVFNNCKLEGYLINLYDKNSGINVKYKPKVFEKFGSVLPEYIKFQPNSLNYYDIEDNT
ncbi:hypothetical protein ACQRC6_03515 [Peptoniphilus sp. SGI.035]|uniref:hypothetical protein n=1 Tax=Peptoniphilus sp. SGI.035 TaxID=3420564 RepID=UPI003CFED4A8